MLFRAVIVDPETKAHNRTAFKLDPWEENLGHHNDVITGLGVTEPDVWILRTWPPFAYNEPTLKEVGIDGDYTLFRRAIDLERENRWKSGDRFQADSYT